MVNWTLSEVDPQLLQQVPGFDRRKPAVARVAYRDGARRYLQSLGCNGRRFWCRARVVTSGVTVRLRRVCL